ncbi:MAG: hypothetical protein JSV32_01880 [Dehalococcoidia bacterium]|nr:MAG: hypothetical protein JSV32_01880 [Dehalococcoidia bacterium]
MSIIHKREIPIIIAAITGLIMVFSYFINLNVLSSTGDTLTSWNVIVFGISSWLGAAVLYRLHINRIIKRVKGQWPFSVVLVGSMTIYIVIGVLGSPTHPIFSTMYNTINIPLGSAMSSLLAFFILSAAYRSLRGKSPEGIVMLIVAVLVMFGNITLGSAVSPTFPLIKDWILNVPSKAAGRALIIAVAVGTIAMGLRTIFGLERGWLALIKEEEG